MELVEHHQVNLDRPVNDYLPTAKLTSPMWDVSKATVRRVANHTAGLATFDRDCLLDDPDCDPSPVTAIRRYGVIVWPPGDLFDYSNLDYGILGEVVAQASHTTFAAALHRSVFAPLGMTDCFVDAGADRPASAAVRYNSSPSHPRTLPKRSSAPGASAVWCSAHDLALFGMFHLKDRLASQKKIMSDRSIAQMQSPSLPPGEDSQYGLSWRIQQNRVLAQGGTTDATAYLQLIPSEDLAIAMLWNTGTGEGGKVIDQIVSIVVPNHPPSTASPAAPSSPAPEVPPGMVGAWSGFMQTYRGRVPLSVDIDSSRQLVAKLGDQPEVRRPTPRYAGGILRWTMPASLGVEGEPFGLGMRVQLHGPTLVGAARTQPAASNRKPMWVYYSVQLEKK